jgi:SAM-dependent methyltransferase
VNLDADWEREAASWIAWARTPGHDSYWYYGSAFRDLLPPPGRRTLDLGCGEGRVARDLAALGHRVTGIDTSPSLIAAAREADASRDYVVGDASSLPFADGSFDVVVAYNSLMDFDDMPGAVRETARVLERGGRFCLAIVHPVNSAGSFSDDTSVSAFVIEGSYLGEHLYADVLEREGLRMSFHSIHRPLETYSRALENAGLLVEALREPAAPPEASGNWAVPNVERWRRVPVFLWLRAVKP